MSVRPPALPCRAGTASSTFTTSPTAPTSGPTPTTRGCATWRWRRRATASPVGGGRGGACRRERAAQWALLSAPLQLVRNSMLGRGIELTRLAACCPATRRRGAVWHRLAHLQRRRLWPVCHRRGQHRRRLHPGHRQAADQGGQAGPCAWPRAGRAAGRPLRHSQSDALLGSPWWRSACTCLRALLGRFNRQSVASMQRARCRCRPPCGLRSTARCPPGCLPRT